MRPLEERARADMITRVSDKAKAFVRSQGGPRPGALFTGALTCRETTIPSHLVRVLLLRKLRQWLPVAGRACRCGRLLDSFGHHRAACARAGVLSRLGSARIGREVVGRVKKNAFVRDLDVPGANIADCHCSAVDTTLVDGDKCRQRFGHGTKHHTCR